MNSIPDDILGTVIVVVPLLAIDTDAARRIFRATIAASNVPSGVLIVAALAAAPVAIGV
jgi:hypothetical protein